MASDRSGAAVEPAVAGEAPATVARVRPSPWPEVPRPVRVARIVIGVVLAVAAL